MEMMHGLQALPLETRALVWMGIVLGLYTFVMWPLAALAHGPEKGAREWFGGLIVLTVLGGLWFLAQSSL